MGKYLKKDRKLFTAFMDLEEAYDRMDRNGLWDTLYVWGGLEVIRSFYDNACASVRVNGELSESFSVKVGVRQGCMMSSWLFDIYVDGCIKEMKVRVGDLGPRLNVRGVEQPLMAGLYADNTVLLAESERMLQRIVDEFDGVCRRRKLKVNAGKSKVLWALAIRRFNIRQTRNFNISEFIPHYRNSNRRRRRSMVVQSSALSPADERQRCFLGAAWAMGRRRERRAGVRALQRPSPE